MRAPPLMAVARVVGHCWSRRFVCPICGGVCKSSWPLLSVTFGLLLLSHISLRSLLFTPFGILRKVIFYGPTYFFSFFFFFPLIAFHPLQGYPGSWFCVFFLLFTGWPRKLIFGISPYIQPIKRNLRFLKSCLRVFFLFFSGHCSVATDCLVCHLIWTQLEVFLEYFFLPMHCFSPTLGVPTKLIFGILPYFNSTRWFIL